MAKVYRSKLSSLLSSSNCNSPTISGHLYLFGQYQTFYIVVVLDLTTNTINTITADLFQGKNFLIWASFNEGLSKANGLMTFTGSVVTNNFYNASVVQIVIEKYTNSLSIQDWKHINASIALDFLGSPFTTLSSDGSSVYALGI